MTIKPMQICSVIVIILHIVTSATLPQQQISKDNISSSDIVTIAPALTEDDIKNISLTSKNVSSEIYGKTNAEQLAELSVIDVIFRKRRIEDWDESPKESDEAPAKYDENPVSVEEVEIVSYEEISSGENEGEGELRSNDPATTDGYLTTDNTLNDSTVSDDYLLTPELKSNNSSGIENYLKPPSEGASCANFDSALSSNKSIDRTEISDSTDQ